MPAFFQLEHQKAGGQVAVADERFRHLFREMNFDLAPLITVLQNPFRRCHIAVFQNSLGKTAVPIHDTAGKMNRTDKSQLGQAMLIQVFRHQIHSVKVICDHGIFCQLIVVEIQKYDRKIHVFLQIVDVIAARVIP